MSSFIVAALAQVAAAVFVLHPSFLFFVLERLPQVATIIIIFLVISVILAFTWLAIGIKERAFFSMEQEVKPIHDTWERIDGVLGEEE